MSAPVNAATRALAATLLVALAGAVDAAAAQDRPSEEELFGAPPTTTPPPAGAAAPGAVEGRAPPPAAEGGEERGGPVATPGRAPTSPRGDGQPRAPGPPAAATEAEAERRRAERLEAEADAGGRLRSGLARTEDFLKLGGILYLRAATSARESTPPSRWTLTAPALTDVYLDVRPSERVRGFALGRLLFDPTQGSGKVSAIPGVALPLPDLEVANPRVLLDQLWIRFDVASTAFLTVGRQHVKWGVGRFWNPTDYLHAVRRNPLALFDERTGTTMVRVHLPWERRGWNFYAAAVLEPLVTQAANPFGEVSGVSQGSTAGDTAGTAGQLGGVGGAARAEVVLGSWELGLDAVAQRGIRPRFGIDLSGAVGEVDVRGELGLRTSSDVPLYRGTLAALAPWDPPGVRPAAVVGAEWSRKYSDEDAFTLGAEYFFNSNGYPDASLYPALLLKNAFVPFYAGRHYGAVYLALPRPGSWNLHSFTLSALANLSDRSGVVRLDWNMTLLTYLTLEAYGQAHLGDAAGEFRLGIDVPGVFTLQPLVASVGMGLRLYL